MSIKSMIARYGTAIKGYNTPLDYKAKLHPDVTYEVFSGRILHLHASGMYKTGVADAGMSFFAFPVSSQDLSVQQDFPDLQAGLDDGDDPYVMATPKGDAFVSLVANGGFEVETTEYDKGTADNLYTPDKCLTAADDDTDQAVGGVLKLGTPYTDAICGAISQGVKTSSYGGTRKALCFWLVWLPKDTR